MATFTFNADSAEVTLTSGLTKVGSTAVMTGTSAQIDIIVDAGYGMAFDHSTSLESKEDVYWTPAEITTALWLDADDAATITLNGSTVSQWADKSGNGNHVSQSSAASQPTYLSVGFSGKPSLRSDVGDSLEAATTALGRNVGGLTAAIVGMYPVGATFNANTSDIYISTANGVGSTRFLMSPNTSAGDNKYAVAGRRLDTDAYGFVSSTTDALANRGTPWIRIGNRDYSGGVANHWTNGTQDLTAAAIQTAGNTSDTDSLRTSIFSGVADVSPNTELSEIVVMHSTMTTTDRQKLDRKSVV